jgi:hypothetical protein
MSGTPRGTAQGRRSALGLVLRRRPHLQQRSAWPPALQLGRPGNSFPGCPAPDGDPAPRQAAAELRDVRDLIGWAAVLIYLVPRLDWGRPVAGA